MGQQQIILIVLTVIIVGTAISVGLIMFQAGALSANKDAIIEDLTILTADARSYYMKPKSFGGGGRSFTGYQIPSKLLTKMIQNASYVTSHSIPSGYQFIGVSNVYDASISVKVDAFHTQPFGWDPQGDFAEE